MVPYGLSQEQFVSMYRRKLEGLSAEAIRSIRALLALEIGPAVDEAHVVIFPGEDGSAPAAWIYYGGKNKKVDSSDPSIFPGRSMEMQLGFDALTEIDEQYFVDPEQFPGLELIVPLLSRWLAECWWKAGGWSHPLPTVLTVHDFEPVGREVLSRGGT
jgi:hypothetical protein